MSNQSKKRALLESLDEAAFRSEVLIPLLKKLHYQNVRETHGREEFGKDIIFTSSTPLGDNYYAVVAKVGDISGAASGKGNLATIREQINMAFDIEIDDVSNGERHRVNTVYVWTSGNISNQAQRQIVHSLSDKYRNVNFKDGTITLSLLEEHYPSFFTIRDPYVSEYFGAAKELYSQLEELRALGGSSEKLRLPVVFVPPTLTTFEKPDQSTNAKSKREVYSFEKLKSSQENILIAGSAGSGKSSLLRRVLLAVIEDNEIALRRTPIPILIEFKRLNLEDPLCVEKAINNEFLRFNSTGLADTGMVDLPDGEYIVMIDALDELKDESKMLSALKFIQSFRSNYPSTRLILTSRLVNVLEKPDLLSGFKVLKVQDLSPDQMVQFVQNWYPDDAETARRLIGFINQPATLRGLPATPLTLALVAILYQSGSQEIPANLTELFQKYTELALGRWDDSKALSLQFEWRIKDFLLRKVSWAIQERNKSSISSSDFEDEVARFGENRGLNFDLPSVRAEIVDRSELLYRNEDDEFEFKHRALQDYFVGAELINRADAVDLIVSNFLDSGWSDAIFFACGLRPESEDYLKAIMERVILSDGSYLNFALNLGFVAQATYLAPKALKSLAVTRVINLFVQGWEDLCKKYDESEEKRTATKRIPPHILFLAIYSLFDRAALGSFTLAKVLTDLTKTYLEAEAKFVDTREEAMHEWYGYFLAAASLECDQIANFKSIFESKKIEDPSFLFLGEVFAREAADRSWLTPQEKSDLKTLEKALVKKLKKHEKYFARLNRMSPIALPAGGESSKKDTR